jgi:hypothetical protein
MYFWSSREGARIGRESHVDTGVRLIEVFPRRPKVWYADQRDVLVKFNASILKYAARAETFGVPIFAGVPLVSSLFRLRLDCEIAWFLLKPGLQEIEDLYCRLAVPGGQTLEKSKSDALTGPLHRDTLIRIVEASTRIKSWDQVVEELRQLRRWSAKERSRSEERFFPWIGGYKPFQVLLF